MHMPWVVHEMKILQYYETRMDCSIQLTPPASNNSSSGSLYSLPREHSSSEAHQCFHTRFIYKSISSFDSIYMRCRMTNIWTLRRILQDITEISTTNMTLLTFNLSWASLTVFPSFFFLQLWPSFLKYLNTFRSDKKSEPPKARDKDIG
jgi:hypothetical protein